MHPEQRLIQDGCAHQHQGRLAEAGLCFARARVVAPRCFDAWHLGGNIALLQGKPVEAAELFTGALRLDPRSAVAAMCLGVARLASGDPAGAEQQLRIAVKLAPSSAEAWDLLATVLVQSGRLHDAVECHRKAVHLNPRSAQAWHGFGSTMNLLNCVGDALEYERRAIAADPHYTLARHGFALALQKCHRVGEAVREYDLLLARNPNQPEMLSHRLMALNYLSTVSREQLFAAHQDYGKLVEAGVRPVTFVPPPGPERRLRVAFLSADFCDHSVAYFLEPLLQHLDRDQFAVTLYSDTIRPDAMTARLRALAAQWRDFSGQVLGVVEAAIRSDAPDILIDLGGHTGSSRLPLFARRLAPVQMTYLGYPNTTGLKAMDYRLVDAFTDPEGVADRLATEKLLRFAPTAWAYAPPASAPAVAPAPSSTGSAPVFGSFNNFAKVDDTVLLAWSGLLDAVPGSRLLIKSTGLANPGIVTPVQGRLRAVGIELSQVDLVEVVPGTEAHLAMYAKVDVALDPFPYNGTTTTCEALWMGVPVVTLAGDRHASRVGVSLLTAAGHPEWIARNSSDYVRIATGLASDPARLQAIRTALRGELQHSTLLDHAGQAARFGAALRSSWRTWCKAHSASEPLRKAG